MHARIFALVVGGSLCAAKQCVPNNRFSTFESSITYSEVTTTIQSSPITATLGTTSEVLSLSEDQFTSSETPTSDVSTLSEDEITTSTLPTPTEVLTEAVQQLTSATIETTSDPLPVQTAIVSTLTIPTEVLPTEQLTTSTIFSTAVRTVTSCAPNVTNCPNRPHVTTETLTITTVFPVPAPHSTD